jgi:hypothetical protein
MSEPIDTPWLMRAAELASHKLMNADVLQGFGLLAVAEAIHRLASAVEGQSTHPGP